jgi:hypothetical protein
VEIEGGEEGEGLVVEGGGGNDAHRVGRMSRSVLILKLRMFSEETASLTPPLPLNRFQIFLIQLEIHIFLLIKWGRVFSAYRKVSEGRRYDIWQLSLGGCIIGHSFDFFGVKQVFLPPSIIFLNFLRRRGYRA